MDGFNEKENAFTAHCTTNMLYIASCKINCYSCFDSGEDNNSKEESFTPWKV